MKKLLLSVLFTVMLLSACSPAKIESTSNRDKWTQANITHYRFQLTVGCFCAFTQQMPLTIEVKDGKIVSMTNNAGEAVAADMLATFDQYDTVERLFDFVEKAQKDAAEVKVDYDSTHGFPAQVSIDYIKNAMDDELSLSVTNFEALK